MSEASLLRRVRALARRKERRAEGAFMVEGIRPVWQALDAGVVDLLIVAPDLLTSEPAWQRALEAEAAGVPVRTVGNATFARLVDREHPSGLAAIARLPRPTLLSLSVPADGLLLALYEVGNPGNLGAAVRTADAAGASAVIAVGESTDPYHPTAVKASMGSLFALPVVEESSLSRVLGWARSRSISVIAATGMARAAHWEITYRLPCLLLLGSEAEGLPEEAIAASDLAVRIPMRGSADSLNLAVAAGILLYEARRASWHGSPA